MHVLYRHTEPQAALSLNRVRSVRHAAFACVVPLLCKHAVYCIASSHEAEHQAFMHNNNDD
jgi:hypothetical protein